MPLQTITTLCTREEVQRRLSTDGELSAFDDDGDGMLSATELEAIDDAIIDASETAYFYLLGKHLVSGLAQSNWVNRRVVDLAVYAAWSRKNRPMPDSVIDRAEKAEEMMKLVADGPRIVPGIPRRGRPIYFSNVSVDPRYTFAKIRVQRPLSSPATGGYTTREDYRAEYTWEQ